MKLDDAHAGMWLVCKFGAKGLCVGKGENWIKQPGLLIRVLEGYSLKEFELFSAAFWNPWPTEQELFDKTMKAMGFPMAEPRPFFPR